MATSQFDNMDRFGPGTAYEEPRSGVSGLVKTAVAVVAVLAVVAFAWVIWIAYDEGVRTGAAKTVPVISADTSAIKRKPAEPGGLPIPHQDTLVFNRLAPGQSDEPVERLLPQPEAPIVRPVRESVEPPAKSIAPTAPPADSEVATALTPKLVEPAPSPPSAAPPDPAEIIAKTPPAAPPPPAELTTKTPPAELTTKTPAAEVAAKTPPPPPAAKPAPATAPGAGWSIQLISLSSREDAEKVWSRLQKANNDVLGSLELRVRSVKLDKGTFYRVQAGPLPDRAAADSLCGKLKSRKQDCLVVAPQR